MNTLYIFDEQDKLDDCFTERFSSALSDERRDKVRKYRFSEGKKQSTVVYLLLRLTLLREHGIDEAVAFGYDADGKPFLTDYPQIHFNLSHCKTAAACAVSNAPIGVDVQHITTVSDKVAKRVLTSEEYDCFKTASNPDEYFCKIWTIKESLLKYCGIGLRTDFQNISSVNMTSIVQYRGKDYFCSVYGEKLSDTNVCIEKIRRQDFEQFTR